MSEEREATPIELELHQAQAHILALESRLEYARNGVHGAAFAGIWIGGVALACLFTRDLYVISGAGAIAAALAALLSGRIARAFVP